LDFLTSNSFNAPVDAIARDLIGRTLTIQRDDTMQRATIVETEAYGGADDPASHAAFKPGGGARIMFERAGLVYVYMAYGMYPCLNIVTGPPGEASAVLLRGALLGDEQQRVLGPGRLGRALGVTLDDNGQDCGGPVFRVSAARQNMTIESTPRIGITRGVDTLWRFCARLD
jgi:DNA-3-methyladenine glycosylase